MQRVMQDAFAEDCAKSLWTDERFPVKSNNFRRAAATAAAAANIISDHPCEKPLVSGIVCTCVRKSIESFSLYSFIKKKTKKLIISYSSSLT